eukprot:GHVQ01028170.1.p1 GENE.GHVQ01028170.1~~GHVQ01028170.1.p1  ORF type:complete len:211 (-),score=13.47 GHVQ01028170.1:84-716(-)
MKLVLITDCRMGDSTYIESRNHYLDTFADTLEKLCVTRRTDIKMAVVLLSKKGPFTLHKFTDACNPCSIRRSVTEMRSWYKKDVEKVLLQSVQQRTISLSWIKLLAPSVLHQDAPNIEPCHFIVMSPNFYDFASFSEEFRKSLQPLEDAGADIQAISSKLSPCPTPVKTSMAANLVQLLTREVLTLWSTKGIFITHTFDHDLRREPVAAA